MRSLLVFGFGLLVGLGVTWAYFTYEALNDEYFEGKREWFVCQDINMRIIQDAVASYVKTNATLGPIQLETLVHAQLLPEWSEIYICPGQFGLPPLRTNSDEVFGPNPFMPAAVAANYTNCSYYVETLPKSYQVRCRYHTNIILSISK